MFDVNIGGYVVLTAILKDYSAQTLGSSSCPSCSTEGP